MSVFTAALVNLSRMLDGLALLAWLPALAVVGITLRVYWLQLTTPSPRLGRWLIPVPMPVNLQRVPVVSYGPSTRRDAYPAAMRRATLLSAGLLPTLLLAWLWLGSLRPALPEPHNSRPITIIGPAPTTLLQTAPDSRGGPPPGPRLKDFWSALIVPTRDRTAPPDSLDILTPEDLATPGPSDNALGFGSGRGEGPDEGLIGVVEGPWAPGPEGDPAPVSLALVDELPVLISLPTPRYPEMARQAGVEGCVHLELLVGPTGKVEKSRILESIPALDAAARTAAGEARFKPATWQHRPVRVWVSLAIRFTLRDAP